ncbi:MAG: DnaJ domain-containing protein [Candidatus Moranbacteria bacterium]|nr:DnaJ domain-containing protein [Candidatus Moranbacteria bacterium]
MLDCYQTLGIEPSADLAQIKKAYRGLLFKHHPDKGGDHYDCLRINQAYKQACQRLEQNQEQRSFFVATGLLILGGLVFLWLSDSQSE